ncbi:MAG TPA: choice-of-anchor J domain-containing protein, partial [Chitinophagaceae bacterium]|nr:choice-of-anchor J domain-containing protein [Chitinophagaceae bacterium]
LATQDPNGNPTNGINRVYSGITNFTSASVGTIKHASSCGADSWDPTKYFNIWVAQSTSLLGIATFPQTGPNDEQGIALALDGFSNNPAYVNANFALGRTAVHEAGHFFGLYHSWGDDSDCSGDDFRQVPGTCLLPSNLTTGDTPNQLDATGGCPSGVRTDNCTPSSPGINYQNYMDYTDDACYSMFTVKQVERAEYMLQNCRTSLMSSTACAPVALFANDAAPKMLSPGSSCYPTGIGTTFCQNTTFNAQVMLTNTGTNNITALEFKIQVGSGPVTTQTWTGNLAPFTHTIVTINNINSGTATGVQPLKIYTNNPNATVDGRPANDTASINLTVNAAGGGVPSVTEGFEGAFPPTGWTLLNPNNGSVTWTKVTTASHSGSASAKLTHSSYSGGTGHLDQLVAPAIDVTDADEVIVEFWRAYKRYTTSTSFSDTLMIQLATQCGATTFPITAWKKGGNDLSTSPGTNTGDWVPAAADWKLETIDIKPFLPAGATSVLVSFTAKNGYGQNQYLDDINIRAVVSLRRDAALSGITNPLSKVCAANLTPSVTITNHGLDPLTTVKIGYEILGNSFTVTDEVSWTGSLAQGQSATVNLKPVNLPATGNFTIRAWTKEPNGSTDQNTGNDTSSVTAFRYVPTVPLPLTESFESATFPPTNWTRINQDGLGTWFRTTAASRAGNASAAIDNYNYNANGSIDDLETPVLSYNGIDSAYLSFQVSHASYLYPGSTGLALDTLQVLVTKDCGQTFHVVYNKWGEDLQTVNNPNAPVTDLFIPTGPTQWRKETVNLSPILGNAGSVQVIFRAKGNYGNTVLLDDINITTKTLPARLRQEGYMIAPNPFSSSFRIQHYLPPTTLRAMQITNSSGQIVMTQSFNGNASSNINVDMTRFAAGFYTVKLIYDNKVITERVIKR